MGVKETTTPEAPPTMLYTITIVSDTRSTIDVDPDYGMVPGAACMAYDYRNHNCDGRADNTIHVNGPEYIGAETYCDEHIGTGVLNLLAPEPNCC
jgi:hypothetical protein